MFGKTKYRLQAVLQLREKAKSKALNSVGICRQKLASEQEHLRNCQQNVEKCRQRQKTNDTFFRKEFEHPSKTSRFVQFKNFGFELRRQEKELKELVSEQEEVVKRAENDLEESLDELVSATKELKVIEIHKEKWLLQRKVEAEKATQKFNDEIGMILFQRNKTNQQFA